MVVDSMNSLFFFGWFFISTFHLHYFKKTFFLKLPFKNSYRLFYIVIFYVYFNKNLRLIFLVVIIRISVCLERSCLSFFFFSNFSLFFSLNSSFSFI